MTTDTKAVAWQKRSRVHGVTGNWLEISQMEFNGCIRRSERNTEVRSLIPLADHERVVAELDNYQRLTEETLADRHALIASLRTELAASRAEVEGLRKDALNIAQTLAWQCFGECRGFSDGLLTTHESLAIAKNIQAAMEKGNG